MIIVRYLQLQNRLSVKNLTSDMNFDGFPVCVRVRNMFYHFNTFDYLSLDCIWDPLKLTYWQNT